MKIRPAALRQMMTTMAWALLAAAVLRPTTVPAATIWVEGERPIRSAMNRHPWWYDQVKREHLSGGDCISNFHDKIGEAAYEFTVVRAGEYQFWVRANPVKTEMAYRLNAGSWKEIDLAGNPQGVANIAADGKPDLRFIAWIDVGKVVLKKGVNQVAFRMHGNLHNHGYLDCFVLTDEPFQPNGILKPGQMAAASKRVQEENKDWFAFSPKAGAQGDCRFDLRSLNERVAGEGGFISAKGSQFIHSKTGKPLRFWAVNGPPRELKDRQALRDCARTLAKYGVNMVRVHGGYYDESGNLKPDAIQHTIDVVECMKQEGIYSHLSIYFPLWLQPKPGTPWLPGYDGKKHPFAALYFNPDFQEQYRRWWKAVLLTPGTTSGKRLIDEPAVAGVEIINEDSYLFWTFNADNIPDVELRILESEFGAWIRKKYGSLDKVMEHWSGQKTARDNPLQGRMGFRPLWNMFNEKSARDKDTAGFLVESQWKFYRDSYQFLRALGFQGVITASNWATASPQIFGPLEKLSYTAGDFIDRHGYFGCNHKGPMAEWSIREGHTYSDRSALRLDPEVPGKPKAFVHPAMDPRYNGKPSMISETTWCRPNRYRSEAPLFYAAYGSLQDSDAVVHFALDSSRWSVKPGFFMQPWTLMSPAMMGQFPAAALIYRNALVAPGDVLVDLSLNVQDLLDLRGTPLPQDAAFDELRLKDVPKGTTIRPGNVIDPLVHFAGQTRVAFSRKPASARLQDLSACIDRKSQTVTSSTGQLKLDYGHGVLTINTPAAQGVSGALREAGRTELKDMLVVSDLELGHIIAVSLDGQPLATAQKILLQVMTEEKGNGFQTEPAGDSLKRIVNIGQDPWLVKKIRGTVKFVRPDAAGLKVTALDHGGYPASQIGNASDIRLDPTTLYYLIGR